MIIVHAYTMIIVHAHPVSTNHMISIVVNNQLKTVKIFDTLCLPLLPDMTHAKKVDQMRDTFKKVKKIFKTKKAQIYIHISIYSSISRERGAH